MKNNVLGKKSHTGCIAAFVRHIDDVESNIERRLWFCVLPSMSLHTQAREKKMNSLSVRSIQKKISQKLLWPTEKVLSY